MTYKEAIKKIAKVASKDLHLFDSPSYYTDGYGIVRTLAIVFEKEFKEVRIDFYNEYKTAFEKRKWITKT